MTAIRTLSATVLVGVLSIGLSALAATPPTLAQQGRLLDMSGAPATGSVTMAFALYDAATAGNKLWSETQMVTLSDGYFAVELGSVTPIPASVFDGSVRYLGVTVNDEPEMSPRETINSVPYALVATNATGDITPNSVSVGGTTVINSAGQWVGPSTGLVGPPGPQGPAGAQGPAGPPGPTGQPGSSVVALSELPGASCPNGGARISSADGVEFVCNGATGPAGPQGNVGPPGPPGPTGPQGDSVVGMSEPIGPNCKYGGVALTADGSTTYVCNGVPGAPGSQGPQGPPGSPGLVYMGAWSASTSYVVGNVVTSGGSSYVASEPSMGVQPPAFGWDVLAAQGSAGTFPGTIFQKTGNNGSQTCDAYCASSSGGAGACLAAKETSNGTYVTCNTAPNTAMTCVCYSF